MKRIFLISWYKFWKFAATLGLRMYFSKIQVEGLNNVPKKGPVLLAVNHQNSFLDPIIAACMLKRKSFFLARGDVFRKKWANTLLSSLGIMPIFRFRDGHGKIKDNEAIFRTCSEILRSGGAVMIFPEGNHYMKWYLRPLQKGIARIAFKSQSDPGTKPITIVPIGLQYEDHMKAASEILMNVGEGLNVGEYFKTGAEERKAMEGLLTDLELRMKPLILNIPEENYDDLVTKWKENRVRFSDLKEQLAWDQKQIDIITKGSNIQYSSKKPQRQASVLSYAFLPIGWITHIIPRIIISYIIKRTVKDPQFVAPLNFALGMIFYPVNSVLWGVMTGILTSNFWYGIIGVLIVALAGKLTIRFWH